MLKKTISIILCASMLLLCSCAHAPTDSALTDGSTAPNVTSSTETDAATDSGSAETTGNAEAEALITTGNAETDPPETDPPETDPPETDPPVTDPPKADSPETEAANSDEYIGTIYTRGQLNALNKTKSGYGPGINADEANRPYGATACQEKYSDFNVAFIAPPSSNVYLTFDLGYENGYTTKILDALKEKEAKAVFFATLSYCKTNPEIVERIINEGHALGNHSVNHLSMPTLSLSQMEYEIMEMHRYIEATYGYKMTLFRPPMGEFSVQSLALTQSLGYKTVHWSFAYYDYDTSAQPEHGAALARVTGAAHGGAIYLLHAVSSTNAAILSQAIDSLREGGYTLALFK